MLTLQALCNILGFEIASIKKLKDEHLDKTCHTWKLISIERNVSFAEKMVSTIQNPRSAN